MCSCCSLDERALELCWDRSTPSLHILEVPSDVNSRDGRDPHSKVFTPEEGRGFETSTRLIDTIIRRCLRWWRSEVTPGVTRGKRVAAAGHAADAHHGAPKEE
jgi:hypothetical protein